MFNSKCKYCGESKQVCEEQQRAEGQAYVTKVAPIVATANGVDLTSYTSDFGPGGVMDYLRKAAGGDLVDGAAGKGLIGVKRSSDDIGNARDVLGTKGVVCRTDKKPNSWWRIDFKKHQVRGIQRYSLRHGYSDSYGSLRHWRLEGSADGGASWVAIDVRGKEGGNKDEGDKSLDGGFATHTWEVNNGGGQEQQQQQQWFDSLRILQTGKNSDGDDYLMLSGWEVYGTLRERQ